MSKLTKWLGLDKLTNKGVIPAVDSETTMWLAFKFLKPGQRADLRRIIANAQQGLDDPEWLGATRAFLADAASAINR
jgi:hypothetical protein